MGAWGIWADISWGTVWMGLGAQHVQHNLSEGPTAYNKQGSGTQLGDQPTTQTWATLWLRKPLSLCIKSYMKTVDSKSFLSNHLVRSTLHTHTVYTSITSSMNHSIAYDVIEVKLLPHRLGNRCEA